MKYITSSVHLDEKNHVNVTKVSHLTARNVNSLEGVVALPSRLLSSTTGLTSGSGRTPYLLGLWPTWRTSIPHRSGADRNEPQTEDS